MIIIKIFDIILVILLFLLFIQNIYYLNVFKGFIKQII
jgi:hypothetical protein